MKYLLDLVFGKKFSFADIILILVLLQMAEQKASYWAIGTIFIVGVFIIWAIERILGLRKPPIR